MARSLEDIEKTLQHHRVATFAIVCFLIILTLGLVIVSQQAATQEEAMTTQSHAALLPYPTLVPTVSQEMCSASSETIIDGCYQECTPQTLPTGTTLFQSGVDSTISFPGNCPQGLVCQAYCPPGQLCADIAPQGRCVNPKCPECENCQCISNDPLIPCPNTPQRLETGIYLYSLPYYQGECYFSTQSVKDFSKTKMGDNNVKSAYFSYETTFVDMYTDKNWTNRCLFAYHGGVADFGQTECGYDISSMMFRYTGWPVPPGTTIIPTYPAPTVRHRITPMPTPDVPTAPPPAPVY